MTADPACQAPGECLGLLVRSLPTLVVISALDADEVLEVSEVFERTTGRARQEIVGGPLAGAGLLQDAALQERLIGQLRGGGSVGEVEVAFSTSRGGTRIALLSAQSVVLEGRPCAVWSAIDVTERSRGLDALAESERRYRAVAENTFDLIAEIDARGRYVFASAGYERVLGYRPEDLVGRAVWEILDPVDAAWVEGVFPLEGGLLPEVLLYRVRHRDGSYRVIEAHGSTYRAADGSWCLVGIGRDVTERVRMEVQRRQYQEQLERNVELRTRQLEQANARLREFQARLVQAERLSATEELAGSVAHAINNPLAALIGTLEMQVESASPDRASLARSLELAKRVRAVVHQTLQLFRQGKLDAQLEAPGALLDDVLEQIAAPAEAQGVVVENKVGDGLPEIPVDRTLVVSALAAIAENALEAMGRDGLLWMEAELLPGLDVVEFRISDTGPGIPEGVRHKLFEPFFTTKGGGTGLGLSIASGIIRGHAGRIHLRERPGGGTIVCVELPTQQRRPL